MVKTWCLSASADYDIGLIVFASESLWLVSDNAVVERSVG